VRQDGEHVAGGLVVVNHQHGRGRARTALRFGNMAAARCTSERKGVEISRTVGILLLAVYLSVRTLSRVQGGHQTTCGRERSQCESRQRARLMATTAHNWT
jgi:hypothetical protein